nr:MAG TPA: hypothetical protein [Caudoviricetes sp.]
MAPIHFCLLPHTLQNLQQLSCFHRHLFVAPGSIHYFHIYTHLQNRLVSRHIRHRQSLGQDLYFYYWLFQIFLWHRYLPYSYRLG